jgi:hypothetical protein
MIRLLVQADYKTCEAIAKLKDTMGGTVPPMSFKDAFGGYFEDDPNKVALGYFEDDVLISFVCISFHESNMRGRFWIIAGLNTNRFRTFFSFAVPETGLLIKAAFDFAEERGYYEYYYCTAEKVMNVYERQWSKNPYQPLGRYEKITLYTVPPNTKPEHELTWRMMGERTKPDTIIFKKRVLKEQFRKKTA